MTLPRPFLGVLLAAGLVAMVGALFSLPWSYGVGCVMFFVVLALHPVTTAADLPPASRLLSRAGLAWLSVAVLAQAWDLMVSRSALASASVSEILAFDGDPERLHGQAIRLLIAAGCQAMACVALGGAVVLRRPVYRRSFGGVGLLVVVAGIAAVYAVVAWRAEPSPAIDLSSDLGSTAIVTMSATVAVNLVAAILAGFMLAAAFLTVDGLRPAEIHETVVEPA